MAKITWLGDDSGAEENTWAGRTFKKGEAVDVDDEKMIESAKKNSQYYKVEGYDDPPAGTKEEREAAKARSTAPDKFGSTVQVPPSAEHPPQKPAPKPGEPEPKK